MTTSESGATAPKAPATARGRRTRQAIVVAARAVFERLGFIDARVADIAREAGVAHGTFYLYFPSKEDALQAVVTEVMDEVEAEATKLRAPTGPSPLGAIAAMNRSYVASFRDNARILLVWEQAADRDPRLGALLTRQSAWYTDRAERSIRRLQSAGLADQALDAVYAAEALCGMVREFCTQLARRGEAIELDRAVDTLTVLWARGIGLDAPPRAEGDDHSDSGARRMISMS